MRGTDSLGCIQCIACDVHQVAQEGGVQWLRLNFTLTSLMPVRCHRFYSLSFDYRNIVIMVGFSLTPKF
jgi:hypothetical protein